MRTAEGKMHRACLVLIFAVIVIAGCIWGLIASS